jgi:hypothetical protein
MKNLFVLICLLLVYSGCFKTEDDTNQECTSDCTTIQGKFVTLNNVGVPNANVTLEYKKSGGELGPSLTRKIANVLSDQKGEYSRNFFINDDELGTSAPGYFYIAIDISGLDSNLYLKAKNLLLGFQIYKITTRDTIIDNTFYIPRKAYIKVNLNNFVPVQNDDYFQVTTLYPFGLKTSDNTFPDSPYSTGISAQYRANGLNSLLKVVAAEGEKNIIRIDKRKNGVVTIQDFLISVPPNNSVELTYTY